MVRFRFSICVIACVFATAGALPGKARADDTVVGNGTATSCTEATLDAAVARLVPGDTFRGGVITFNCGVQPLTIAITTQKSLGFGSATLIDGGGRITLDAGNVSRHFFVTGADSQVQLRDLVLIGGTAGSFNGGSVYVGPSVGLTLERVLLRDNRAGFAGGAILTEAGSTLVLANSTVGSNDAPNGGGIAANGNVTLTDSLIFNNTAEVNEGGGLQVYFATTTVLRTRFENNAAVNGGGFLQRGGTATITDSSFSDNVASANGGGLHAYDNARLTLINTGIARGFAARGAGVCAVSAIPGGSTRLSIFGGTFAENQAQEGGAVYARGPTTTTETLLVRNATLRGNIAGSGGAIYVEGIASVSGSRLIENQATDGGGLHVTGVLELSGTRLTRNVAGVRGGGALVRGQLMGEQYLPGIFVLFQGNVFSENRASIGGGLSSDNSAGTILETSFASNAASNRGGAMSFDVTRAMNGVTLRNITTSQNQVTQSGGTGGDVFVGDVSATPQAGQRIDIDYATMIDGVASNGSTVFAGAGGTVALGNSVVWPFLGAGCGRDSTGIIISTNGNIGTPATCPFTQINDRTVGTFSALMLGAPADNGGGTPTYLPAAGSPVLERGLCNGGLATDQRRLSRPIDADGDGFVLCDAGSVERQLIEVIPSETIFVNGFEGP